MNYKAVCMTASATRGMSKIVVSAAHISHLTKMSCRGVHWCNNYVGQRHKSLPGIKRILFIHMYVININILVPVGTL